MVTPCAQYQPETLPPAAAKGIDQGQDGASMGREEAHPLVQADCRRAWCLLQGRPSSWCSTFPGARRTRETRCLPWGGRSTSSSTRQPESSVSAARPPIELVLDVPGGQTYPRDSVLALGGMSTSSSTRQPESSVSAARPPIELVLDVPGGQTYPRDSVLALGGMSTSSSTRSLSGVQHLRRGQVVAAATAPFLAFGNLQPGDAAQMHFVRAVSDAQAAGADPQIGQ